MSRKLMPHAFSLSHILVDKEAAQQLGQATDAFLGNLSDEVA